MLHHVFGDRGLADVDPELEQFAVNARRAPQRVGQAHFADQLANFQGYFRPATARSRFPAPELAEAGPMPADHGLGFDDLQGVDNPWRNPKQNNEDQTIEGEEACPLWRLSLQHAERMAVPVGN